MSKGLILSVKPKYAARILDGTKITELRTRHVAVPEGTTLIVYATSPQRAIVGTARLQRVMVAAPEAAWEAAGDALALDRREFDGYTCGRSAVSLLFLEAVTPLDHPIHLTDLRNGHRFHPPQGYRYVSSTDPEAIRALITRDGSSPAAMLPARS